MTPQEKEVSKAFSTYWKTHFSRGKGALEKVMSLWHPDITAIGTGKDEIVKTYSGFNKFLKREFEEIRTTMPVKILWTKVQLQKDQALVFGETEVTVSKKDNIKIRFRVSSVFKKQKNKWLLYHIHGSFPASAQRENESFPIDGLLAEKEKLEKEVAEKTSDLLNKNRELEIEAALERVRAVAMGMKKPADMVEVCKVISNQLKTLGVKDIRNIQTVIINERNGKYLNYEYFTAYKKGVIEELEYNKHPKVREMVLSMKKSADTFFGGIMKGDELKVFRDYRKIDNQFPDPLLDKSKIAQYNFYSIGLGGLGITSYKKLPDTAVEIFKRFHKVFKLAYSRFKDIEQAEAQAREAQIQVSLERVRASAMSMHKSDELLDVCEKMFKEFLFLGFDEIRNAIINIHNDADNSFINYDYAEAAGKSVNHFTNDVLPFVSKMMKISHSANDAFSETHISGKTLAKFRDLRKQTGQKDEPRLNKAKSLYFYFYSIGIGAIGISTYGPINNEKKALLKRFRDVFNLSYKRYIDISKAEAQTREAEIQLALERVRARTMAMHKSDELAETAAILFQQMTELGVTPERLNICLIKEADKILEVWATDQQGIKISHHFNASLDEPTTGKRVFDAWKEKKKSIIIDLSGKELNDWIRYVREIMGMTIKAELVREHRIHSVAFFSQGMILTTTPKLLPEESIKLLERFADVFNLTYRRFLDLQKAETQAREARIEAALEKVRARAMSMNSSDDLALTVDTFFSELNKLNIVPHRCGVGITNPETRVVDIRATTYTKENISKKIVGKLKLAGHPVLDKIFETWKQQKEYHPVLRGKEILEYYKVMNPQVEFPDFASDEVQYGHYFNFKEGGVFAWTDKELSENDIQIFRRFTTVLSLTYRRYIDLKEAEAQARKSQIEAALERVRARSMAMHKSDELKEVVRALYKEFRILVIDIDSVNIQLSPDSSKDIYFWSSVEEDIYPELYHVPYSDLPIFEKVYNAFNSPVDGFLDYLLNKEEKDAFFSEVFKIQPVPFKRKKMIQNAEGMVIMGWFHNHSGIDILRYNLKRFSEEEKEIVKRFSAAFEQTYIRFLDLQKAEMQAKEAVKQASLDRVRGEIASMRTAEDLNRITPIIWRELKALEVPFIRCGVFIIDEDNAVTQVYLTTPEGKSLGVLNLSFDANELTTNTVEYWKNEQVYKEHWNKEEFINWTKSMMELGQVQNAETYQGSSAPPESLYLHFVPFTQGMLYVGDVSPLPDEKLNLVKTLAEAFSIAYARYEDFKNLEEAKNKIEITLRELKSAQAQLIHAEKLASLGELTAGIAHEIKNPLNFVNNFSEISGELLDEIKEELEKNDKEEVFAILEDLKQNLEKINYHGKRADSIVKGMLLHSRGTSGEKTPTDINDLLDQYVNLAYHGMRAQNKEFNIAIEKDFDETLEKINVVPQDISRVFLNIINNSCYAANERKIKSGDDNFFPTLKVSTKNLNDKIEIKIADNGNGIPKDIIDKIFQPFFTTKPTGEGTGLGLSLSYDIVTKVHGGDLKVKTKDGEGAEFVISLPNV